MLAVVLDVAFAVALDVTFMVLLMVLPTVVLLELPIALLIVALDVCVVNELWYGVVVAEVIVVAIFCSPFV